MEDLSPIRSVAKAHNPSFEERMVEMMDNMSNNIMSKMDSNKAQSDARMDSISERMEVIIQSRTNSRSTSPPSQQQQRNLDLNLNVEDIKSDFTLPTTQHLPIAQQPALFSTVSSSEIPIRTPEGNVNANRIAENHNRRISDARFLGNRRIYSPDTPITPIPLPIPRSINNLLPQPLVNNNLVSRSIIPIDPRTSGISLKELTFKAFHTWKLELEQEQVLHQYEELKHGYYIRMDIIELLSAKWPTVFKPGIERCFKLFSREAFPWPTIFKPGVDSFTSCFKDVQHLNFI